LRDGRKAACRVEPCGELAGDGFVLDESVLPSQPDGLFVETLGVELPPFDSGDLGADQRGAVAEVRGAVIRPYLELPKMRGESFQVRRMLVGGSRVAVCGSCKRGEKAEFGDLKK
jgi:hypothetical protein